VLLDARSNDTDVPSVVPDEVLGGETAVRELVRHGHRRIGFINNVDDIPATHGRLEGYRQALAEAGIAFDPRLVVAETASAAGAYRAALTLLQAAERPTALFCFADRMAMGVYHAAAELGLSIPADLSIIGFDNQELICDGMFPGLTTVALPHYEMGARAVAQLLALTGAKGQGTGPAAQEMLPCPLVARASVASPPRL
jgi:LacI family transcriptional regulator